ncbi:MAPK regulated corepressor interacting protein 2-like isoform X2 [Pollicipes pollicipes]|uniref:MAPK regulated corepressor interacting protein 2-like isoform X2 n=1 Tax=Pollicipes pollicipes TaxID=41117 RepID=UPI001885A270|nr:MAPK regulated corepressor interacting protein 2-like isoform X2 [Pollicipes pollicipes]
MYAVTTTKRPSRIVTRTRPGRTPRAEALDAGREQSHKSSSEPSPASSPEMSSPRPTFTQQRRHQNHARYRQDTAMSAQHQEDVRYLSYTWRRVQEECENSKNSGADMSSLYYQEPARHPALQDFEPFDLESWWGRRLYQQLTGGTS